ncbi:class V lanthionine synthetase subunit LxmK [Kitasatospora sp. NPDC101155]|uniref:class V lanthionine synthetase subunit LxmK n=1 Tax=Kitasatospora sp. NPDC101155 TaxID=3364097 RepID=UPI00381938F8
MDVRGRFEPVELSRAPEVGELFERLGLGGFGEIVTSHSGRNDNWAGVTSTGARVFVKRHGEFGGGGLNGFDRALSFEKAVADRPVSAELRYPAVLGHDRESRLVAFEWLEDARSGADLAFDGGFGEDLSEQAGRCVGHVHDLDVGDTGIDDSVPPMPPVGVLDSLTLSQWVESSGAQLKAWALLQLDPDLAVALRELRAAEASAGLRPGHCDLRLDQFLVVDEVLHLTDWEEFRLADPARDVGSFAGEWLYQAVKAIPAALDAEGGEPLEHGYTHEAVVAQGVRELERLRPRIEAFCRGYREVRGEPEVGLAERAARYAGWHLIERMIAAATRRSRVAALDLGAAGIGRSILLKPAAFIGVLGLGGLA